jgi:hypothetical protein
MEIWDGDLSEERASISWSQTADHLESLPSFGRLSGLVVKDNEFYESEKLFWMINKIGEILPVIEDSSIQREWFEMQSTLKFF